jgi:hypothetical protein
MTMVVSQRIAQVMNRLGPVAQFFTASADARRVGEPGICDFAVGNPHELALPGFVAALGRSIVPQNNAWFGYKNSEPEAREIVAAALRERRGLPFDADDILLTNGAFAALAVVLGAIIDPGDEVIFLSPPWFFYEALIAAAGAQPVRVKIDRATFDLDLGAIEAAIGPRTRALIVNSPHNPTGRISGRQSLSCSTICGSGWLAGRRKDGRHQLLAVAATCDDMCQGLIEATVAMRCCRVRLIRTPDHSWPRAKEARMATHSASLNTKKPGWPLLPEVALTQ